MKKTVLVVLLIPIAALLLAVNSLGHLSTEAVSPRRVTRRRKHLKAKARFETGSNKVKQETPRQTAIKVPDFAEPADLTPVANCGITYDTK